MANQHQNTSTHRRSAPATGRPVSRAAVEPDALRQRLLVGLPVRERWLSLNGIATAVLEGGDGPPIVLLHGPGAYGAQWRHLIPDLVATHRVIAPDLPGHGASDPVDPEADRELVIGWLDDLLECTCDTAPVLVGHTLGGAIAARFAADRSDRLAALVPVDSLGLTPFQPAPSFGAALEEFLANPVGRTHDGLWSQCLFDLESVKRRLGEDEWKAIRAYNLDRVQGAERMASLGWLMDQFGLPAIPAADLARIAVPTALIWGREDRATPLSVAEEASSRLGWPLYVIDDAADDPTLDRPEVFSAALRRAIGRS